MENRKSKSQKHIPFYVWCRNVANTSFGRQKRVREREWENEMIQLAKTIAHIRISVFGIDIGICTLHIFKQINITYQRIQFHSLCVFHSLGAQILSIFSADIPLMIVYFINSINLFTSFIMAHSMCRLILSVKWNNTFCSVVFFFFTFIPCRNCVMDEMIV